VPDQRCRVAVEVSSDGVHMAALALRAASPVKGVIPDPCLDVDLRAELVPEQCECRVTEGERGVERGRGRHRLDRAPSQAQYVTHSPVVGADPLMAGREG